jgi:hypothetical protein
MTSNKFRYRILCFFGIHMDGVGNLGMYGDASRCDYCGTDAYGLFIIRERNIDGKRIYESSDGGYKKPKE